MRPARALSIGALALAACATLAALALTGGEAGTNATADRLAALRPLVPAASRVFRDHTHGLSVSVPPGWRRGRESNTLAVATFAPRVRPHRACGNRPDMPQVAIGPREALLHVEEQLEAQPGTKPPRPRVLRLSARPRFPWPCLNRQGVVGLRTSFREHGRLLHVTAVAGRRTGTRRRRVLLGVLRSLRFGPPPPVEVRVDPAVGRPGTRFRLELTATHTSGRRGRRERGYWALVHGPPKIACVIEHEAWFSGGRPGARVRAVLDPTRTKGQRWCRGRFTGVVRYRDAICRRRADRCDRVYMRRAGRFSFTVR
jgi:hypothetical protein